MHEERAPESRWRARPHPLLVRALRPIVRKLAAIHDPVRLEGASNLPSGPALLVGNHGLLGYESPFFFERVLAASGRLPIGLADRWFFRVPVVRDLLVRMGGTYGSAACALGALQRGDLVVCYPGGAREVLKHERDKYRLLWQKSVGFARLAVESQVPVVPFAAAGVDDTFHIYGKLRGSGALLMGHEKYDLPIVTSLPKPVPLWFRLGDPVEPPVRNDETSIAAFHREVWTRTQKMVDELVRDWRRAA